MTEYRYHPRITGLKTNKYESEFLINETPVAIKIIKRGNHPFRFIYYKGNQVDIARLVLGCWKEMPPTKKMTANHIDGDYTNYYHSNLEWSNWGRNSNHPLKLAPDVETRILEKSKAGLADSEIVREYSITHNIIYNFKKNKKTKNSMAKTLNVKTFLTKKFDLLPFEGAWKDSFGQPGRQDSILIYGSSGSGKTELAMQLGKYLTNFGKVAYNSIEQRDSFTLQRSLERNNMDMVADKFQVITGAQLPELTERLRKQRSPDFLIIDSVQYLEAKKSEYFEFKEEFYKKKGLIWISQVNGKPKLESIDDKIKGALANDIWYDVDIQVPVVGFHGFPQKRLNGGEETFIINHERAAKYWAKIK